MTRKDKLIQRLLRKPRDFSWDELSTLLSSFGFALQKTGKSGGSRRRFVNGDGVVIALHEPHPSGILKRYQVEQIIEILGQEGLL